MADKNNKTGKRKKLLRLPKRTMPERIRQRKKKKAADKSSAGQKKES